MFIMMHQPFLFYVITFFYPSISYITIYHLWALEITLMYLAHSLIERSSIIYKLKKIYNSIHKYNENLLEIYNIIVILDT